MVCLEFPFIVLQVSNGIMGSIAEKTLGKRAVFYMRNEAMVGRITRHRLQTLASILGVSSIVKMDLDECHDGEVRYR